MIEGALSGLWTCLSWFSSGMTMSRSGYHARRFAFHPLGPLSIIHQPRGAKFKRMQYILVLLTV